ncbi:choline/ethanolamine transporter flvcr2a-like isoform X1 [Parasteatoda tepidariorum]|uniref:choline/ethanolamine transporter flvcr2a-like isoform X1 n=1 Tax=Parasteatoda tepidariorum TaxID=114398 RepID=UPI0039BC8963
MGSLFIVAGLIGSMIAGTILDYTHKFKETALCICVASLITLIIFCSLLAIKQLWVTFLTIIICGFFLTSFLPVGLEYGIELTFPEPEVISASLLNSATMIFGFILTTITSSLLENFGQVYSNIALAIYLLISLIITAFLTSEYKRSKNHTKEETHQPHISEENVERTVF